MTKTTVNDVPTNLIDFFGCDEAILVSRGDLDGVMGCSTFDPMDLVPLSDFDALDAARQRLDVHSILMCVLRVSEDRANDFAGTFPEFSAVADETMELLRQHGEIYSAYTVTHSNRDDRPAGNLTVSIGGDCYRDDQTSLEGALERTALLAKAMARKAVMMFPDVPVLHGGKKGEWILVDRKGQAIGNCSEQMKIFMGALSIRLGIEFLNEFKNVRREKDAGALGESVVLSSDSASPDTLSGKYWPQMCEIWRELGFNMKAVTCVPPTPQHSDADGPRIESALPTGYGVAATATSLVDELLEKRIPEADYLIEALGNVSYHTIDALVNRYGVRPDRIVAFDKSPVACRRVEEKFPGVQIFECSDTEFYDCLSPYQRFDVWINNGLGNRTTTRQIEQLLATGIRVFCGGANNLLRKSDELASLAAIWKDNAWIWPDEASSGGGWAFAVMELRARTLGHPVHSSDFITGIAFQVERSNRNLIETAIGADERPSGKQLWERVASEIDKRIARSLGTSLSVVDAAAAANSSMWNL